MFTLFVVIAGYGLDTREIEEKHQARIQLENKNFDYFKKDGNDNE